jgi:hypothetical protein
MRSREKQTASLLAGLALLQAACTTTPSREEPPGRPSLGRVAVVAARFQPNYVFKGLVTGKGDAARKAGDAVLSECRGAGPLGDLLLGLFVCIPVAGTMAISGALTAAPADRIQAANAAAQGAVSALDLPTGTLDAILRYGDEMGIPLTRLPRELGPASPGEQPSYREAVAVADSVIEISVYEVDAFTPGASDLRISLGMWVEVRVLKLADGKVLDIVSRRCKTPQLRLDEWLASERRAIRLAFERCAALITEELLDELFLVYHPKRARGDTEDGASERVPPYALRAIEPPIRNVPLALSLIPGAGVNKDDLERHSSSDLRPAFRWEPWPRGFDILPGNGPGQPSEVRYELRVLDTGGIAYQRRDLTATTHRLEQPLAPCRSYRWTVRAKFLLEGEVRTTEWTAAYDHSKGSAPWRIRSADATPTSSLPFYPILETPCLGPPSSGQRPELGRR